jgi:uncharacterized metal-binding protein YceD (DUF177 family)
MKVYLHEIKESEKRLAFTGAEAWLSQAVEQADEKLDEPAVSVRPAGLKPLVQVPRAVETHLQLRKVDDIYMVSGTLKTHVHLICSRCAQVFPFGIDNKFSSLFCKDPVLAGVGHLSPRENDRSEDPQLKPAGRNYGIARSQRTSENGDAEYLADLTETTEDLEMNYLAEDYIDLGSVVTEQIRFQLPFQPLCKEECKGMCPHCGANWNEGTCACSRLRKGSAFSSLSQFKVKGSSDG